jgi:hypothetical protein
MLINPEENSDAMFSTGFARTSCESGFTPPIFNPMPQLFDPSVS